MTEGIKNFITAMVVVLFGLLLLPTIISNAITAATTTGIGSFGGVAAMIGLIPLGFTILAVWYIYNRVRSGAGKED